MATSRRAPSRSEHHLLLRQAGGGHAVLSAEAVEQLPLERDAHEPLGIDRRVEPALNQFLAAERSHCGEVGGPGGGDTLPALLVEGRQTGEIGIGAVGGGGEAFTRLQRPAIGGQRSRRLDRLVGAHGGLQRHGGERHVPPRLLVVTVGLGARHFSPEHLGAGDLAGFLEPLRLLGVAIERLQRLLPHVQHVGGQPAFEVAVHQLGGELVARAPPLLAGGDHAGLGGTVRGADAPAGEHRPAFGRPIP